MQSSNSSTISSHQQGAGQPDLFDTWLALRLPRRIKVQGRLNGNHVRGYSFLGHTREVKFSPLQRRGVSGQLATDKQNRTVFVLPRRSTISPGNDGSLLIEGAATPDEMLAADHLAMWLTPKPLAAAKWPRADAEQTCKEIVESWVGQFQFREEQRGAAPSPGLRRPQIGALYATLAHWSVSNAPATIVMPTGTGKTETMLAILACSQLPRLMVVLPNTALRDQIADKFLTLGKLIEAGCLPADVRMPIVATLTHRPTTPDDVDQIFLRANVIVSTMQIAGQCDPAVQVRMAELCSHLFIDEAHHIAARTWADFKRKFDGKPILQFTATPFRTDGKRVDGKFIYSYPLSQAQAEGYFRPITFIPVEEFDLEDADTAIAKAAGDQLTKDLDAGHDHILMARAETTARAEHILQIYREELPEFSPVIIHSGISSIERRARLEALRSRDSRVLICVDMFGEGFDFPQLKVAALHDRHKSLAITLQFIGRFTRDATHIGDAHVIANIADEGMSNALRTLYAEDADWNYILKTLGEAATDRARKRAEILEGFTSTLPDIPLQILFPRMTAIAYRTTCEQWEPTKIEDVVSPTRLYASPVINPEKNLAIFITRDEETVRWGAVKQIENVEWNLHVLHWNEEQGLLFINSSSKDFHEKVAEAVSPDNSSGGVSRLAGAT